jgi:hypothetical protein
MKSKYAYDGDLVRIQNVAPVWNGEVGKILRWVHDQMYVVAVEKNGKKTELVLNADKGEFEKLSGRVVLSEVDLQKLARFATILDYSNRIVE